MLPDRVQDVFDMCEKVIGADPQSRRRSTTVIRARKCASYILVHHHNFSRKEVSEIYGIDHSTICNQILNYNPFNPDLLMVQQHEEEMKRGKVPNADEKRWLKLVAKAYPGRVIHHPVGSTARHRKIDVGNYWIIPMMNWDHTALHNQGATFGFDSRKDFEKACFVDVLEHPEIMGHPDAPPPHVIDAIADYHR